MNLNLSSVILSMRVPFLLLTPVCVFLGASVAFFFGVGIKIPILALAATGAVLAHIAVNTFNEYFDFQSGLDLATSRTPFSGGSGALPANPHVAKAVLSIGIICSLVTVAIGVFFYGKFGIGILATGVAGMILIVAYTRWINKLPSCCLIAPGTGFGILMVTGTQYVLAGEYFTLTWLVALVPFFLVNNLLLLNQYPDIDADRRYGRNHFPIAYGVKASNVVYALFLALAIMTVIVGVLWRLLPGSSLIALAPMPLAFYALRGAVIHGGEIGAYSRYLASNVAVALLSPLLLGFSLTVHSV